MATTMEEFIHQARQHFLQELTPEEQQAVFDRLPPEERLRGLGPEERLRGLSPKELRKLQNYLKTLVLVAVPGILIYKDFFVLMRLRVEKISLKIIGKKSRERESLLH